MNKKQVFSINNEQRFNDIALVIFKCQAENCIIYKQFIAGLKIDPASIVEVSQIPFLPIEFFKSHLRFGCSSSKRMSASVRYVLMELFETCQFTLSISFSIFETV